MRSSVESRRCGCGAILALRESCPACARDELPRDDTAAFGEAIRRYNTEAIGQDMPTDELVDLVCNVLGVTLRSEP